MSVYNLKLQKGLEALMVSNASAATSGYRRIEARSDGWYDIDDAGVATRLGDIYLDGTGANNEVALFTGSNSIHSTSEFQYVEASHLLQLKVDSASSYIYSLVYSNGGATTAPYIMLYSDGGTLATSAVVVDGQTLGVYSFGGAYQAGTYSASVSLEAYAEETWGIGSQGSSFYIKTMATGSAVKNTRLKILEDGYFYLSSGAGVDAIATAITDVDDEIPTCGAVVDYVTAAITSGIDWQDSVIDKDLTAPPGSPTTGDRYIVGGSATGDWATHDDDIAEYNGATWDFTTPNEGFATWVEDEDVIYIYNGSAWVKLASSTSHNNLSGLQGGTTNEYYHLTSTEYSSFITGSGDTGGVAFFTGSRVIATDSTDLSYDGNKLTTKQLYIHTPTAGTDDYDKFLVLDTTGTEVKYRTGAQVLSDIGAGTSNVAITNNTNNYVLTATGTDSINGESNLTFDGTTLGLTGSQTISANLTLSSTSYFYVGTAGTVGTWRFYVSGDELIFERCTNATGPVYTESLRLAGTA